MAVVALVLVWFGWHRQPGVVGEHRDDAVDVSALERVREGADQHALGRRMWQRRALWPRWLEVVERRSGALQRAVDRHLALVKDACDLGGVKPEHVAQHEHRPLAWREALERSEERERDGLLGFIASVGTRRGVGHAFEQRIGVGLEPCELAKPGGWGGSNASPADPGCARRPESRSWFQAAIGGDPVQPRA